MNLIGALITYFLLVITVVIHEYSHARAADHVGDPTARLSGRMTLNPLPHLDPIGTVVVPLAMLLSGAGILIGWAKPVPFDPFNLSDPHKDSGKIALAGPLSNFAAAIVSAILLRIIPADGSILFIFTSFVLTQFLRLNILIGLFNLLPVSPLDGFKVVGGLLPKEKAVEWYGLERYGMIFLLFMIFPFFGNTSMLSIVIGPPFQILQNLLIP